MSRVDRSSRPDGNQCMGPDCQNVIEPEHRGGTWYEISPVCYACERDARRRAAAERFLSTLTPALRSEVSRIYKTHGAPTHGRLEGWLNGTEQPSSLIAHVMIAPTLQARAEKCLKVLGAMQDGLVAAARIISEEDVIDLIIESFNRDGSSQPVAKAQLEELARVKLLIIEDGLSSRSTYSEGISRRLSRLLLDRCEALKRTVLLGQKPNVEALRSDKLSAIWRTSKASF